MPFAGYCSLKLSRGSARVRVFAYHAPLLVRWMNRRMETKGEEEKRENLNPGPFQDPGVHEGGLAGLLFVPCLLAAAAASPVRAQALHRCVRWRRGRLMARDRALIE